MGRAKWIRLELARNRWVFGAVDRWTNRVATRLALFVAGQNLPEVSSSGFLTRRV